MKRLPGISALLMCLALLSGGVISVYSQDAPEPLVTVTVDDVQAMATSGDGTRLFVTDARANLLRVFSLEAANRLTEIAQVALEGTPTALAAARDYALVTVDMGSGGDALESIGPDPLDASRYSILNIVDVPDNSRTLDVGSDFRWALVIGDSWYSLVQIISATDMIGYPSNTRANPQGGSMGASVAFIAQDSPAQVVQYLLRRNQSPRASRSLALDASPSLLRLNERLTFGAVVSGGQIILFDTATMRQIGSMALDGVQPTAMQFTSGEQGELLVVATAGSSDLRIFDTTNRAAMGEMGSFTVGISPQTMLITDGLLIVSDGREIRAYDGF